MTQKLKFKVDGMKCSSCAILIEDRVKKLPGVEKVKVSDESCIGVAVFDDSKLNDFDIFEEIEKIGGFKLEKLIDNKAENSKNEEKAHSGFGTGIFETECPFCKKKYSLELEGAVKRNE